MLWTILVGISSFAVIVGGIQGAREIGAATLPIYAISAILVVSLAIANAWVWWRIARAVDERLRGLSEAAQNKRLPWLYLIALVWGPFASGIGYFVPRIVSKFM